MTNLLLPFALIVIGLAVWGFVKNRTALSNIVVFVLGLVLLGGWISTATDSTTLFTVLGLVVLLGGSLSFPILVIALLANGLVMYRRESRTLGNMLSLLVGVVLVFMVWSMTRIFGEWDINPALGWGWITAAVILGYFSLAFAVYLVASWAYSAIPTRIKPAFGIVLGARLIDGQVPPLLRSRLDRAVALHREFLAQDHLMKLIPTGGQGADETKPEGVGMAEYLATQGIEPENVIVEDRAANTRQNLLYSRALMDNPGQEVAIVTNNYHVFRAALLARKLGMRAHVYGAKTKFYYLPSAVIREFLAIMVQYKWLNLLVVGVIVAMGIAGLVETLSH